MKRTGLRILGVTGVVALGLSMAACANDGGSGGNEGGGDGGEGAEQNLTVGVAMPNETYERWVQDGNAVKDQLEEAGYEVDLQYAADDIPTQQEQIEQMITNGADILIVASIDGTALANQLQGAADEGIPVIAYDRLINDTEAVDFYVTFDNYTVGVQQATSLLTGLGYLDEEGNETDLDETKYVELFGGAPIDNNSMFFYNGAIDTLQPYIDEGLLEVRSGQTSFDQVKTDDWEGANAQQRMDDILTQHYGGGTEQLDGVLAPADPLSRGIINSLTQNGYPETLEEGLPVVTGQDAEAASAKLISDGVQYSTIFKDTRKLAEQAAVAAVAYAEGEEPEPNDTESYDNGVKVVPSFLLESDIIVADNVQELLVDSGYLSEDDLS